MESENSFEYYHGSAPYECDICLTGTPPLTGSGSVRVVVEDVNDHSPEFDRSVYVAVVQENKPSGTFVVRTSATDLDEGDNAKIK